MPAQIRERPCIRDWSCGTGSCCCDYGFHMTIDDWNPGIEAEIDDMYAAGISSFKMYMTYPAMMIGDEAMYHAKNACKEAHMKETDAVSQI